MSLAVGLLALIPARIQAQTTVLEKVSVSGTIFVQGASTDLPVSNPTTSTTKAPSKSPVSTAILLKQLCKDEFSEGNGSLTSANVPTGAALYFNGTGFEIDKGTNQIVDVSDIITVSASGQNDISAGSFSDANGQGSPPFTQTDYQLYTVTYDDSSSTGDLQFTVTGLGTVTGKATNPNAKSGKFTQSSSFSLTGGTGEGVSANGNFVVSGFTITASGSASGDSGTGSNE